MLKVVGGLVVVGAMATAGLFYVGDRILESPGWLLTVVFLAMVLSACVIAGFALLICWFWGVFIAEQTRTDDPPAEPPAPSPTPDPPSFSSPELKAEADRIFLRYLASLVPNRPEVVETRHILPPLREEDLMWLRRWERENPPAE